MRILNANNTANLDTYGGVLNPEYNKNLSKIEEEMKRAAYKHIYIYLDYIKTKRLMQTHIGIASLFFNYRWVN